MAASPALSAQLSLMMNGMAIMQSANRRIDSFCFNVISRFRTNPSRCFLYSRLSLNHTSNLFEPRIKQYDANRRSGVVGIIGRTMPIMPSPRDRKPARIKSRRNGFLTISTASFREKIATTPTIQQRIIHVSTGKGRIRRGWPWRGFLLL